MRTDYKIIRITRFDDGRVEVVANIYEGDVTTENERRPDDTIGPVTRYRRTARLRQVTLNLPDLPLHATDAQIRRLLYDELKKDTTRTPIAEQT